MTPEVTRNEMLESATGLRFLLLNKAGRKDEEAEPNIRSRW